MIYDQKNTRVDVVHYGGLYRAGVGGGGGDQGRFGLAALS